MASNESENMEVEKWEEEVAVDVHTCMSEAMELFESETLSCHCHCATPFGILEASIQRVK